MHVALHTLNIPKPLWYPIRSPYRIPLKELSVWAHGSLLGGSWVVLSGVISRVTTLITHIKGLTTPLITTHEPPSRP